MRAFLFCAVALTAMAQSFEVASVKPNHTGDGGHGYPRVRNGAVSSRNVSLKTLVTAAYALIPARVVAPDWLDNEYFDITAKAPQGVPDTEGGALLQALLKERFHAQCHLEAREMQVYELVVDKGGSKLVPFDPAHLPVFKGISGGSASMGAGTTHEIADSISYAVQRPVIDKTAIEGKFGFVIHYGSLSADAPTDPAALPDIFSAVQQQLGLRLISKKATLDVLVVDSIDRTPSEN